MSRDDGFRTCDLDVGILDDPKMRRLVRATGDESTIARVIVAYLSVLTSSWERGERVSLEDAGPLWLTGLDELALRLQEAELLNADGRIPEHAWSSWFVPAFERREERRASGRLGGLAKAARRGKAQPEHSPGEALPVRTLPSLPTDLSLRAREIEVDRV